MFSIIDFVVQVCSGGATNDVPAVGVALVSFPSPNYVAILFISFAASLIIVAFVACLYKLSAVFWHNCKWARTHFLRCIQAIKKCGRVRGSDPDERHRV